MHEGETVEQMIGRVVGKVGPTMMLTSFSESLAFFLGEVFVLTAAFSSSTVLVSVKFFKLQAKCNYVKGALRL